MPNGAVAHPSVHPFTLCAGYSHPHACAHCRADRVPNARSDARAHAAALCHGCALARTFGSAAQGSAGD